MTHDMDLLKTATDLISIHKWVEGQKRANPDWRFDERDYELHTFLQLWGNTSGGFQGVGGSAMTEQRTYVVAPKHLGMPAFVFFGGRYAYSVIVGRKFADDLVNREVAGLADCRGRYD